MTKTHYSRLQSVEESKQVKQTFIYVAATICLILLGIFVGIPILANIAGLAVDVKKSSLAIDPTDTIPPPPPVFDSLPAATNKQNLTITGRSEPGSIVVLQVNTTEREIISSETGIFEFKIDLTKGENSIFAYAKDRASNKSKQTKSQVIVFDNKAPDIAITAPADGAHFFGSTQKNISVTGKTDPNSQVLINDHVVLVNDQGAFNYQLGLNDGDNTIIIKSTDLAGNTTEKSLIVTYSP